MVAVLNVALCQIIARLKVCAVQHERDPESWYGSERAYGRENKYDFLFWLEAFLQKWLSDSAGALNCERNYNIGGDEA